MIPRESLAGLPLFEGTPPCVVALRREWSIVPVAPARYRLRVDEAAVPPLS